MPKPLLVVADGAYTVGPLIRPLKKRGIVFVGRLKHTARLYRPLVPGDKRPRGRPARWGKKQARLSRRARGLKYRKVTLDIYSETVTLWGAGIVEVWPHAGGSIKGVVTKEHRRHSRPVYLRSSDPSMSAEEIIVSFSARRPIEIAIRNAKSELELGEARVRTRRAVLRVTNFCLWIQTRVILAWVRVHGFADATSRQIARSRKDKTIPSFADMLIELREQEARRRIYRICRKVPETAGKVLRFVRPLLEAA